jgi:hypothetical protein
MIRQAAGSFHPVIRGDSSFVRLPFTRDLVWRVSRLREFGVEAKVNGSIVSRTGIVILYYHQESPNKDLHARRITVWVEPRVG